MVPTPAILVEERPTADARMKALYKAHAQPVYRYLLQLTFGQREIAEDLLQETMLRAWRKIEELNADIVTLRPWLLTVAQRIAIDAGRARRARPAGVGTVDVDTMPTGEDGIGRMLAIHTIKLALGRLTPEHRGVIIEIYFRGRSTVETAAILGIPEGTVKSRTYHALRSLRAMMVSGRGEE